jgi:hypothetical protein
VNPVPVTVVELTMTDAEPFEVNVTVWVAVVFNVTLPNGTLVALMLSDGPAAVMVNVSVALPVPALLVALTVAAAVPAVVGVPEIRPVAVFTDRPEGNPVAAKLVGVLLAVI